MVCRAVLGSEFREEPRSVDVAVGTDVLLGCRAPRGEPEPRVRWQKDGGDPVRPDDRVTVSETGTLRIHDARQGDSGSYVCVAYNIGGEKESAPARLTVRGNSYVHLRINYTYYLRQGSNVFARFCLFVCLSVCLYVC